MNCIKKSKIGLRGTFYGAEDKELITILEYISYFPDISPDVIHIANEAKRSVMEHVKLKRMGLKKGASDLFFAIPKGVYHGLFIEHKTKVGKPTPEQLAFIDRMNFRGYFATLTFGVDDALNTIKWYLSL